MPRKPAPRRKGIREPQELPSGSWRGWARRKDGSRIYQTFGPSEYGAAIEWMTRLQLVIDGHVPATDEDTAKINGHAVATAKINGQVAMFADYVAGWAATTGGEVGTRRNRVGIARDLAKRLSDIAVADIRPSHVRALVVSWEDDGIAPGTRCCRMSNLRNCMAQAIEDGLRTTDPTRGISAGNDKAKVRPARIPNDAEVDRVLEQLPDYTHAGVLLARDCGLRLGELAGVRWRGLDLTGEYSGDMPMVTVSTVILCDNTEREYPKGKRKLSVPLSPRLVEVLTELRNMHPPASQDGFVFVETVTEYRRSAKGHPIRAARRYGGPRMSYRRWRDLWDCAAREAGLRSPQPTLHQLRHARGHQLGNAGVQIQDIARALRHANISNSLVYMPEPGVQATAIWPESPRRLRAV